MSNPNDKSALQDAYSDEVKQIFHALFTAFVSAQGDKAKEGAAETLYRNGIGIARHALDRAVALLPAGP